MRRTLRGLVVWLIIGGAPFLRAVEKNWIAHEAQVIVVGTMHPNLPFPWIDGWHMSGTITVEEVLYGREVPPDLDYRLACKWEWHCDVRQVLRSPDYIRGKGLWFLRWVNPTTLEPSFGLGFDELRTRGYWEDYIRRNKP